MGTIKIKLPEGLEDLFRRKASKRLKAKKGVVTDAGIAAISMYSGVEPTVVLVVDGPHLSVEAPTSTANEVLSALIQNAEVQATTPNPPEAVRKILGDIEVSYASENYTAFKCRLKRGGRLAELHSFRAEWAEKELVYEDGCMLLSLSDFEEALSTAEDVAPLLGLKMPRMAGEKHLEIYKWAEAQDQEVIIR